MATAFFTPKQGNDLTAIESDITRLSKKVQILTTAAELSIKMFGAIGDGVTDCTAAIQAAVTACPLNGILIVPIGTYVCTSTITIAKSITLFGRGGVIISNLANPGTSGLTYTFQVNADQVVFDKVTIKNPSYTPNTGGIQLSASRCTVQNCNLDGFTMGVVAPDKPTWSANKAVGNTITNVVGVGSEGRGDGVLFLTESSVISNNIISCKADTDGRCGAVLDFAGKKGLITNNVISGPFRRSIHVEGSPGSVISANTCTGATQWGIILASNNLTADANVVDAPPISPGPMGSNPSVGIYANSVSNCTVSNNIVNAVASNGANISGIQISGIQFIVTGNQIVGVTNGLNQAISIINSSRCLFQGNNVAANVVKGVGFLMYNSQDCTISGNHIDRVGGSGLAVQVGSVRSIIQNNTIKNSGSCGIIVESSSHDCNISGNHCFDSQTTKTQLYGLSMWSSNNILVTGNNFSGNINAVQVAGGALYTAMNNVGVADYVAATVPKLIGDVTTTGTNNTTTITAIKGTAVAGASTTQTPNTLALRDGSGNLVANNLTLTSGLTLPGSTQLGYFELGNFTFTPDAGIPNFPTLNFVVTRIGTVVCASMQTASTGTLPDPTVPVVTNAQNAITFRWRPTNTAWFTFDATIAGVPTICRGSMNSLGVMSLYNAGGARWPTGAVTINGISAMWSA